MSQYELSDEEIEMIREWYHAASGESATSRNKPMFDLLEKFGIEAANMDLWLDDPQKWSEPSRPRIEASNAAVLEYLSRHPELKDKA